MHTMESHVSAPVFGTDSQFILKEVNSACGEESVNCRKFSKWCMHECVWRVITCSVNPKEYCIHSPVLFKNGFSTVKYSQNNQTVN